MALDDTIVIEEDESEDAEKIKDQYIVKGMSKNEAKIDKINIILKNKVEVLCKPPYVKGCSSRLPTDKWTRHPSNAGDRAATTSTAKTPEDIDR